jgi:hypothetical protein
MSTVKEAIDYMSVPLDRLTLTDLTDAIGVAESAALLQTSARAIYTVRNTKSISVERVLALREHIRTNETHYRERLTILREKQNARKADRATAAA